MHRSREGHNICKAPKRKDWASSWRWRGVALAGAQTPPHPAGPSTPRPCRHCRRPPSLSSRPLCSPTAHSPSFSRSRQRLSQDSSSLRSSCTAARNFSTFAAAGGLCSRRLRAASSPPSPSPVPAAGDGRRVSVALAVSDASATHGQAWGAGAVTGGGADGQRVALRQYTPSGPHTFGLSSALHSDGKTAAMARRLHQQWAGGSQFRQSRRSGA